MTEVFRSLSILAVLVSLGCAGVSSTRSSGPIGSECGSMGAAQAGSPVDFSGLWQSNWGPVEIYQQAGSAQGRYYDDRRGQLSGVIEGNALNFQWEEFTNNRSMQGMGRFVMCADQRSFSGRWGSSSLALDQLWNAKRDSPVPAQAIPQQVPGASGGSIRSTLDSIMKDLEKDEDEE